MTTAARFGDVTAIDRGTGLVCRKDRRQVVVSGVTIDAGGGLHPALNTASVKAAIVGCVRVRMKLVAAEVGKSLTGSVTSLAIEPRT